MFRLVIPCQIIVWGCVKLKVALPWIYKDFHFLLLGISDFVSSLFAGTLVLFEGSVLMILPRLPASCFECKFEYLFAYVAVLRALLCFWLYCDVLFGDFVPYYRVGLCEVETILQWVCISFHFMCAAGTLVIFMESVLMIVRRFSAIESGFLSIRAPLVVEALEFLTFAWVSCIICLFFSESSRIWFCLIPDSCRIRQSSSTVRTQRLNCFDNNITKNASKFIARSKYVPVSK